MKSPSTIVLAFLCAIFFVVTPGFVPSLQAEALNKQFASYFGEALKNSDISWTSRVENGKNYLQFLRFGLKESFINDFLRKYPPQKDGDMTIKELFLERMEAKGNQLNMLIGGVVKYKPANFFQATGNFIVPAHLAYDQSKKDITFTIESKFEKLRTKQFNLDVKKISNKILQKLNANDQVEHIQIPELMAKIELFKLLFSGFVRENGYVYVTAVPEKPLWVTDAVIKNLESFKALKK